MACFYKGFVFEYEVSGPLTVEGRPVAVERPHRKGAARTKPPSPQSLEQFARCHIDEALLDQRKRNTRAYLSVLLNGGAEAWNQFRRVFPDLHPVLADEDLRTCGNLDGCDFSYTNLTQADMRGLFLRGASFHQAILAKANLSGAHLQRANFCRTDLYETNFKGAHFAGANLQGVQLAKTNLKGADLTGCNLYGLSAWDLWTDRQTRQARLRITYEPLIQKSRLRERDRTRRTTASEVAIVDSIDLATFIYMTLNNRNISRIFNATGKKWVLLLGRFTKHKDVLTQLTTELKKRKYVPIIFDFSKPDRQDLIETVTLLEGMSAFVIVDISDPRSTPMELQAIAPNYGVPIVPIIRSKSTEFGTFCALRKYPWVLPLVRYPNVNALVTNLDGWVIRPARARGRLLRQPARER